MNRYKFLIIVLFLVFVFSFSKVNAIINNYSLIGKTIYLDAGHGGKDSGAVFNDILEKDINLIIVKKLESILISRGATVYLTRDDDYDLSSSKKGRKRSDLRNRANVINKSDCDLYVSIHLNYIRNSRWNGLQIFYNNKNDKNELLAKNMTDYLKEKMKNVRDYKIATDYYMYNLINKPGVLMELGFLSNPDDRYILTKDSYQNIIVLYIADALEYAITKKI